MGSVREYLKERNSKSPYLFISRQGEGKLNRSRINKILNKYSGTIAPHKLRHFFCSQAQNVAGYRVSPKQLSRQGTPARKPRCVIIASKQLCKDTAEKRR